MNIKTKEIYSELYQVLNLLGDEYINKLPKSLFNMLKDKRDVNYNIEYTEDIPLYKQSIKRETLSIIALIHLNYWCENDEEKNELKNILKNNEDNYQEKLREKYNSDDIYKKHKQNVIQKETAMIEYKESILKKFINKIKKLIHIN